MCTRLYVKYPLFLSYCNKTFSRQIFEKTQISNFIKIRLLEAELFRVDAKTDRQTDRQTEGWTCRRKGRETDMTKLIVAFRNFVKTPKALLPLLGFEAWFGQLLYQSL